jgi:hypothetical protein
MIRIYGHSDDCLEIKAGKKSDEIGCYDSGVVIELHGKAGGGLRVVAKYAPGKHGVWRFGVELLDEDFPLLPARIETQHAYSLAIVIDAEPEDVSITTRKATEDDQ